MGDIWTVLGEAFDRQAATQASIEAVVVKAAEERARRPRRQRRRRRRRRRRLQRRRERRRERLQRRRARKKERLQQRRERRRERLQRRRERRRERPTAAARGPLRMRRRRQRLRLRLWPHWRAYIASVSSVQRSRSGVTLLVLNHAFSRHTKRWAKGRNAHRGTATGGGPPVLGWFVILMGPEIIPEPGDTATLADK